MDPSTGGPCQGIRNSIPELKKLGVNNEVVCLDDPTSSYISKDLFCVHAIGPGKSPWCYSRQLIPWLLKNFHRFDVVIIHGLWLYSSHAVVKAIKLFKTQMPSNKKSFVPKLYVMPHGMLDPYFQRDSGRKLKAIRNLIYWKFFESKVINTADGLLFTCERELELARQPFRPYRPKKELNIGYGIQSPPPFEKIMTDAFVEKCPGIEGQPFILFLSRIHEKKGIDNLIQAYSRVIDEIEKKALNAEKLIFPKLVIAGPGLESVYGEKMQLQVSESKTLQNSIYFTGMLTGNSKWGAFYNSKAFILPSHQENFGIAIVEALACGKPVLITNKVNIWKEILFSNAGIVHDDTIDGTVKLLYDFILLSNEDRDKMNRQAQWVYKKYFDVKVVAGELINAINS